MGKNEPMRIGMIMGKWLGGGVEAVIMNYYRHIDRNKIQFDFICDSDSGGGRRSFAQAEDVRGVVPENAVVFVLRQPHIKQAVDVRLRIPHGIIGAEHYPVRAPCPDQRFGSFAAQRVESGGSVHHDIVKA